MDHLLSLLRLCGYFVCTVLGWAVVCPDQEFCEQGDSIWECLVGLFIQFFSSKRVIVAASCTMTTMNSIMLMWMSLVAIACFVATDQCMSNRNLSSWQKAPPPFKHASPKLVNWGSRGMTCPMFISHLYIGSARNRCRLASSALTGCAIVIFAFFVHSRAAILRAIIASTR